MRLTRLIVLIVALITSAGFYMLYRSLNDDLESQTFQATEESLIDTAHILSGMVEADINAGTIDPSKLKLAYSHAHSHQFTATIYHLKKTSIGCNAYITDQSGSVIYDSNNGIHEGKDMSKFNDVYLARQDKYAARSSRSNETDSSSSVLYIGVPIKHQGEIIGTLSVYKAQKDVLPFIHSRRKWIILSLTMIALGIIVFTLSVFAWIFRPIGKLTRYAHSISRGERPSFPPLGRGREVNTLGKALKDMRESLDGRQYIHNYTQILTHELKSPLAAIRGSAELLEENMPADQRVKFLRNIQHETQRSQRIIDGLLKLTQLETQTQLLQRETLPLLPLAETLKSEHQQRLAPKNIRFNIDIPASLLLRCDPNLLLAALANLLENSIHFSPHGSTITLSASQQPDQSTHIILTDEGPGIPDYALGQIYDRFYSISKPNSSKKSSGLGLSFVKEIIDLHQAQIQITNRPNRGTQVKITFP